DLSKDLQEPDIINMEIITKSDHRAPLINLDLKTFSMNNQNQAQKLSKEK
ncbi:24332_t:CDS:1, partial [Gigaspora margarita]